MATATTPEIALTTVEAGDTLPEAVVKDNFETIDSFVAASQMTNKSGASVSAGAPVIVDTTTNDSFTTTTTANSSKVVGIVQETIADNAAGIIKHHGPVTVTVTGSTLRGDWLITSTTAGKADPVTATDPPTGAFAIATSASSSSVTAILMVTANLGAVTLAASASPTPTTEGLAEWDSDDDRIIVGDGSGQKTFYSGAPIWQHIETQVLAATATTLTLASIASSWKRLKVVAYFRTLGTHTITLQLNNDTGANYTSSIVTGVTLATAGATNSMLILDPANTAVDEANYLELSISKPETGLEGTLQWNATETSGTSPPTISRGGGVWLNTADLISEIDITASVADSFKIGTRIELWGSDV